MIFLDPRDGSKELMPALQKTGLPVEWADPQLEFGDLFWVGRGEGGKPVTIGVEFKTVQDLVNSLRTARLQGHQLPGMKAALEGEKPLYDFGYLLVEGHILFDKSGRLLRRKGKKSFTFMEGGFTIDELFKRINVMHLCAGLNPVYTIDRSTSIAWLAALYRTWTDEDLDKHKSHLQMYEAPTLVPTSQFCRTVRTLPGVGMAVAKAAEKKFIRRGKPSLAYALSAHEEDWAEIETVNEGRHRKFGMLNAAKVVEAAK